ncbi:MAG: VanZ family protein, partial [Burkholderiaceae bacterium]
LREVELQPLVPAAEVACVVLGLLIPCLLGYCIIRSPLRRAALSVAVALVGIVATGLSAALSYSPEHAWVWLTRPVLAGAVVAPLLAVALVPLGQRSCAALALLLMGFYLAVLNQAPVDPYLAQTLQSWEQGRFIRFNGLAQWLGWVWPYAALFYLFAQMREKRGKT